MKFPKDSRKSTNVEDKRETSLAEAASAVERARSRRLATESNLQSRSRLQGTYILVNGMSMEAKKSAGMGEKDRGFWMKRKKNAQ